MLQEMKSTTHHVEIVGFTEKQIKECIRKNELLNKSSCSIRMLILAAYDSVMPGSGNNGEISTCIAYGDCTGGTAFKHEINLV